MPLPGKVVVTLDQCVEAVDGPAAKQMWTDAIATLGELPCARSDWRIGDGECDDDDDHDPPKPHETCRRCFTWRDCTDPDCEHPACGSGPTARFRDAFTEAFPDLGAVDVLMGREDPEPLAEHGRMPVLVDEVAPIAADGEKVLAKLTKAGGQWLSLYQCPIKAERHIEAEVWLVKQGVPVECAIARYQTGVWIALAVAAGKLDEVKGGMQVHEFRLAQAPVLDYAPGLTQGALF